MTAPEPPLRVLLRSSLSWPSPYVFAINIGLPNNLPSPGAQLRHLSVNSATWRRCHATADRFSPATTVSCHPGAGNNKGPRRQALQYRYWLKTISDRKLG